jgi:hypothetical protein
MFKSLTPIYHQLACFIYDVCDTLYLFYIFKGFLLYLSPFPSNQSLAEELVDELIDSPLPTLLGLQVALVFD